MKNNIKKHLAFAGAALLAAGITTQAQALTVDVFNVSTQEAEIDAWINSLGGQTTVLEDFENLSTGWYQSLATGIGTFSITDNTLAGTGSSSYDRKVEEDGAWFEVRDYDANGRYNTTDPGSQYLDSADITELSLNVTDNTLNNLFFFMTDPSDVRATTTASTGGISDTVDYRQSNGSLWFIGIDAGDDFISEIIWSVNHWDTGNAYTNDGFGLDDFSTVSAVPLPGAVWLFGSVLAGFVGFKRFKKKS